MLLFTEKGRKGLLILFLLSVIGGFGYAFVTAITPVSLVLFYVLLLALYFSSELVDIVADHKNRHEKLNSEQKAELEKAKQKDEEIEKENKKILEKATKEWEEHGKEDFLKKTEKDLKKYQNEIVSTSKKIIASNEKIEKMDILGDDEKQIKVIDMLIYFIESHRADNIKEALHEYDDAQARQELIRLEQEKNNMIQQHNQEMQRLAEESARLQDRMLREQREHNAQMESAQRMAAYQQQEYERQMKRIAQDNASNRAQIAQSASYIANQMALDARDRYYNS